jgi:hypothetical protein
VVTCQDEITRGSALIRVVRSWTGTSLVVLVVVDALVTVEEVETLALNLMLLDNFTLATVVRAAGFDVEGSGCSGIESLLADALHWCARS